MANLRKQGGMDGGELFPSSSSPQQQGGQQGAMMGAPGAPSMARRKASGMERPPAVPPPPAGGPFLPLPSPTPQSLIEPNQVMGGYGEGMDHADLLMRLMRNTTNGF